MWRSSVFLVFLLLPTTPGIFETGGGNNDRIRTMMREEIQKEYHNQPNERSKRSRNSAAAKCAKSTPQDIMCQNEISGVVDKLKEGDIHLYPEQEKLLGNGKRRKRKVLSRPFVNRWDPKRIPYKFHSSIYSAQKKKIKRALKIWESETCIHFEHDEGEDSDYMFFINGGGCYSGLGRATYWRNDISVGILKKDGSVNSCLISSIIHEIGHSLGFTHEQNRPDRDKYVKILWENIDPEMKHNFDKYKFEESNTFGKDYDFNSIMHYGTHFFSKNKKPTIVPLDPENVIPTHGSSELSNSDIEQMNKAYCTRMLKINSYITDEKLYDIGKPWIK